MKKFFREKKKIFEIITDIAKRNKLEVYIVGGYIRDYLLNIKSSDIDILVIGDATKFGNNVANSLETQLSAVYENFGTALLNHKTYKIEFATARSESYDRDSRKPTIRKSTLEDDLARRDFTINTLAVRLGSDGKLIDNFNGIADLKNKIIRTPLDPNKTFFDDPLRILRAIRFASKFNFSIEENTLSAIISNKNRLLEDKVVSQERITNEFLLTLSTDKPSIGLNLLYLTGIMEIIFPEISALSGIDQRNEYHHKDVLHHTFNVVDNISKYTDNIWLRFSALVHDIAKPKTKKFINKSGWTFHGHEELGARMMKKIFTNLRLPFSRINYVEKLIRLHLRPAALADSNVTDSAIRRLAAEAGNELEDLLMLCRADITSKNPEKVKKYIDNYNNVEKRILEVQKKDELRNFQSPIRGDEIMRIFKISEGKAVGIIKKKIEDAILDGIINNNYDEALDYLNNFKDEFKEIILKTHS